jgi:hypothetical protein
MTHKHLNGEWARSQIEAYVDGSLNVEDSARMQAAMAGDDALRAGEVRAAAVRRELRAMRTPATSWALAWRLLRIPEPRAHAWAWLAGPAVAAALIAVVVLRLVGPPAPAEDARAAAAVQEFALAMAYLQKTAEVTQREVNGAVAFGFSEALDVGRNTVREDGTENGG